MCLYFVQWRFNWHLGDNIFWARVGGGAEQSARNLEHYWWQWRLETENRSFANGPLIVNRWCWSIWGAYQSGTVSNVALCIPLRMRLTYCRRLLTNAVIMEFWSVESAGVPLRVMCQGSPVAGNSSPYRLNKKTMVNFTVNVIQYAYCKPVLCIAVSW